MLVDTNLVVALEDWPLEVTLILVAKICHERHKLQPLLVKLLPSQIRPNIESINKLEQLFDDFIAAPWPFRALTTHHESSPSNRVKQDLQLICHLVEAVEGNAVNEVLSSELPERLDISLYDLIRVDLICVISDASVSSHFAFNLELDLGADLLLPPFWPGLFVCQQVQRIFNLADQRGCLVIIDVIILLLLLDHFGVVLEVADLTVKLVLLQFLDSLLLAALASFDTLELH